MLFCLILYKQGSLAQWQTVFFMSAGIYLVTDVFYVIFGTGVEQSWNKLASSSCSINDDKTIDSMSVISDGGCCLTNDDDLIIEPQSDKRFVNNKDF